MKAMRIIVPPLLATAVAVSSWAQGFSSGSDGSDGDLIITENTTLTAPDDGIWNLTSLTVDASRTLTVLPNANNTPVYILSTGDVVINGVLDLAGKPGTQVVGGRNGPGGFPGGNPGSAGVAPGDGQGPGGGTAGAGSTGSTGAGAGGHASTGSSGSSTLHGPTYGSALLIPPEGGSGGGGTVGTPGYGGGGGGGAVLIASDTRITIAQNGSVDIRGGGNTGGAYNGGSSGSARLIAPAFSGTGFVNNGSAGGGGVGRVRIDTLDRTGVALRYQSIGYVTIGSMMLVAPDPMPRLDITQVAGTDIGLGSGPVLINLPFGSDPNRTITVRAQDFGAAVPITLALLPDSGAAVYYDTTIDNAAANPATAVVDVVFPLNVQTSVMVWTR